MPPTETESHHDAVHTGVAYLQGDQVGILDDLTSYMGVDLTDAQREQIRNITEAHFRRIAHLMDSRMFPGLVMPFPEAEVNDRMVAELSAVFAEQIQYAAVVLDRALYHGIRHKISPGYLDRVTHLSLTRPATNMHTSNPGGKVSRIGDLDFDQQVAALRQALEGREAFIVDDTYVEGGTSKAARMILDEGGIQLAPVDQDRFHFRAVRQPDDPWKDARASQLMRASVASAEQREFTAIGGNHNGASRTNATGYVVPGFAPFSNGAALRLDGRLDLHSISASILDIDIDYILQLEEVLGRELSMIDVRRSIPSDAPDEQGVRTLINEYIDAHYPSDQEGHINFVTFMRSTKLTHFLRFARQRLEQQEKPAKEVVCVDMDGVIAKMKHVDGQGVGFKNSKLELAVREGALKLLMHLEKVDREEADRLLNGTNTELGLVSYLTGKYGPRMEQEFGEISQRRIRTIFRQTLPRDIAEREADAFLKSMPLAYHVFRVMTWDHDLSAIYDKNQEAAAFTREVIDRGGQLVFVTAAPKIHALKMLRYEGITAETAQGGQYKLYTVEDMYQPGTVENGTYREGDKGMIMLRIRQECEVPADQIAMGGDQFKSDVRSPIRNGVAACIIRGPEDLAYYASLMRLPNDSQKTIHGVQAETNRLLHGNSDGAMVPVSYPIRYTSGAEGDGRIQEDESSERTERRFWRRQR